MNLTNADEALILASKVAKLQSPNSSSVEALQIWSEGRHRKDGLGVPILADQSGHRLQDQTDLVGLRKPTEQDWLTRFVRKYLRVFFVVCLSTCEVHLVGNAYSQ